MKLCPVCNYHHDGKTVCCDRCKRKSNERKAKNPGRNKNKTTESRRKLRRIVIEFLGGKCVNCGFSQFAALQIDHVHGNGNKERKTITGTAFLKKVISDTEGNYQLLCANCNWIKRDLNGEVRTI